MCQGTEQLPNFWGNVVSMQITYVICVSHWENIFWFQKKEEQVVDDNKNGFLHHIH